MPGRTVRRWFWWLALSVLLGCSEHDGRKNLLPPPPALVSGDEELQFYPSREELSQVTDDPQSRREYLLLMERDPATGVVPPDIRRLEREYDRRLPRKRLSRQLRTDGTAETGQWSTAGPYNIGGRTRALALDHTDEDIILAGGVTGGMWRSEDGGQSWSKTTNPGSLHSVTCLAQDIRAGKTGIWYYGTGEIVGNSAAYQGAPYRGDGIFKSEDGGKTWNRLAATAQGSPEAFTSPFQYVHSIATNPFNATRDEIYAAAVGSIYRSVNGGATWRAVLGPDLLAEPVPDINSIRISQHTEVAIAGNGQFYATLSERGISNSSTLWGIFWSNNGQSWYDITPRGLPRPFARTVIAPSPSNPGILYFLMDSSSPNLWKYEFQRFDGEKVTGRWTNLSDYIPMYGEPVGDFDTQGSYNMVLKVHPADEKVVFMGGTNLYRASEGFSGNVMPEWIGGYDTANNIRKYPNHFVDQHALVFYPSNPDKMLSANDGGIFITGNNRARRVEWSPVNNGYYTSQLFTLAVDEYTASRVVIGGFMDNGVLTVSNPDQRTFWKVLLGGDGAYGAITKYGVYHYTSTQNGRIIRFTLDRNLEYETFARIDPIGGGQKPNQGYLFVNPFVLAPENQNIMYLAGGDKIWRNDNLTQIPAFRNSPTGVNWVSLEETSLSRGRISSLAVSHNPPGLLVYGSTVGEVYRVADARAPVVEPERVGAGVFPPSAYVSCIAVDRLNSDHYIVAFANYNVQSIYSTSDGGQRFEPIGGNLEQFPDGSGSGPSVRWVEIVSLTDGRNRYFAGTSTGLYSTGRLNGAGTVWEKESEELIGDALVTMIRYRSDDGRVFAATHGRGIFEARYDDIRRIPVPVEEVQAGLDLPFPNPFETSVTIPFFIPEDGYVRIRLLNTLGQEVKTLMWSLQFAGKNVVTWDGSNVAGTPVTPGMYIVNMEYRNRFYSKLLKYAP